jgi:hypothetical protein
VCVRAEDSPRAALGLLDPKSEPASFFKTTVTIYAIS